MPGERRRVAAFCPLCVSRCGCEAVVENGRLVAIEPDPSHPTGRAPCAKGRASPELVEASDRLLYPMRRTHPKGDPDPGWQRITWDEALAETATAMRRIAAESGPEAVALCRGDGFQSARDRVSGHHRTSLRLGHRNRPFKGRSVILFTFGCRGVRLSIGLACEM